MKKPVTLVLFALVGLTALSSGLFSAPSRAQTPGAFEVVLPAHALDLDIPGTGGTDLREAVGALTAYAEEERCTSVDLEGTEGDVVLSLGGDDQPEACSREGAFVTFQNGQGQWLATGFTLEPGARVTLDNFAPVPPGAPPPRPTFDVTIPGSRLDQRIPDGLTWREALGRVTAFADGEECFTGVDASVTGDILLRLGLEGQPAACSREGAIVTFRNERGHWLATWLTLRPGYGETLTNFAPTPPCSPGPCPTPGPSPTAAPAGPASGAITPPAAGNAGLRSP